MVHRLENELAWSLHADSGRAIWTTPAYFRTHERDTPVKALYWVEWTDQGPRIILNRKTAFYCNAYARTHEGTRQRAILDLLMWAIATAENPSNSDEKRAFWDEYVHLLLRPLNGCSSVQDEPVEEIAAGPKRKKYEVMLSICEICNITAPAESKGSTVPTSFYLDIVEYYGGERNDRLGKHKAFELALEARWR